MDGFKAAYDNNCFILIATFAGPTSSEIEAFKSDSKCEIRFTELNGVIYFIIKLGNLPWMDAPFTPHWYDPAPFVISPVSGLGRAGYMMQLVLIDSRTNNVISNRIIGLGHEFSMRLYDTVINNYGKHFNSAEYQSSINTTYRMYDSRQMAYKCPDSQRYIAGTADNIDNITVPDTPPYTDEYPDVLRPWACIPADNPVPSVNCLIASLLPVPPGEDINKYLVSVPLQYLLDNGYKVRPDKYIVIDAEYSEDIGLIIPDKYYY